MEEVKLPYEFLQLIKLRESLNGETLEQARLYIRDYMADDVIKLQKSFNDTFKDIPTNDKMRIEILMILAELGISIYG